MILAKYEYISPKRILGDFFVARKPQTRLVGRFLQKNIEYVKITPFFS